MQQTLKNPPVHEAIIEFNFENAFDSKQLESINKYFKSICSKSNAINNFEIYMDGESNPGIQIPKIRNNKVEAQRYFFDSNSFIVTTKENGIVFSKLKPYTSFVDFFNRTKKELDNMGLNENNKVSRVGVRYINNFIVPAGPQYISEYLEFIPPVPDVLNEKANDFVSRISTSVPDLGATCIVTQTVAPLVGKLANCQATIDLDLYKEFSKSAEISNVCGDLKALKAKLNLIFFRIVSKKTLDLFL